MPVQTSYPGVYIQEVPSGVHTITGVSTSIAAFIGRTAKGPLDRAVRCLSFSDFLRTFGGPHPSSDLASSVRHFFDNGGTDCYVVRIAHNAAKAEAKLENLKGVPVLTVTARDGGLWGNNVYLSVDYNTPTPDETFNLAVSYEEAGKVLSNETHVNLSMDPSHVRYAPTFVTQNSTLISLAKEKDQKGPDGYSEARRVFKTTDFDAFMAEFEMLIGPADKPNQCCFFMSVDGSEYVPIDLSIGGDFLSVDFVPLAGEIEDRINGQLVKIVPGIKIKVEWQDVVEGHDVLRFTSDTLERLSVRVRRSLTHDFAGPMLLGLDQGGVEPTAHANLRPAPNATYLFEDINIFAKQTQKALSKVKVAGIEVLLNLQTTNPEDFWFQAPKGHDGVREKLKLLAGQINGNPNLAARAEVWGYRLVLISTSALNNASTNIMFTGLILDEDEDVNEVIKVNTRRYALGTSSTSTFLSDGHDGRDDDGNPLALVDYVGNEADQTGIYALDGVDLFNLMVIPGDRDIPESSYLSIATTASIYCKMKRAFLILDAPDSWTVKNRPVAAASEVNALRAFVVSDHSAVYYPKIVYSDLGIKKTMGPSGMIAGLFARTDSSAGVWKAPAGVTATLQGAIDLELNLTDNENGVLNKLGVNCLRRFPSGNVSWGARTLAGSDDLGSEWKYVPIRRLALMIGESLYRGTKWAVFEPNDEPLWARIRQSVGTYMNNLFRQGAFQGASPSQAYFVKCDKETTTQADRDLGIVYIQVGFAPLKPAEFIVIQIQQMAKEQ